MGAGPLTRLQVADEGFLVSSLIERCPRAMMLRELVRNALEAAGSAPAGHRLVEIDRETVDGTPKLRIRNTGRGMNADELFRMADLTASIRKQHGLGDNFGMGAKVASLPSNRVGLRYRSSHDGTVLETLLGWRDGHYGRVGRQSDDGDWHHVWPAETTDELWDASFDWTDVTLFGNDPKQDTSLDPYLGDPAVGPDWLQDALNTRFFRIGPDLRLTIMGRPFRALEDELPRRAVRLETVQPDNGVKLHYAFCPQDAEDPAPAMVALVFRGELYDVRRGLEWLYVAPLFGIPFGAESILVLIELGDDFPIVPDAYRQFLRHGGGDQRAVTVRDFASPVFEHRPRWLRDLIAANAPGAGVDRSTYTSLQTLLRTLGVRRRHRAHRADVAPIAHDEAAPGEGSGEGHAETSSARRSEADQIEPVPEILLLRRPEDIAARGVEERAGRYYPETHQLFLNAAYPAVTEMSRALNDSFATHQAGGRASALAIGAAEQAMAARVGRMLVFALAKQECWPEADLAQGLSPHALSLAADDWRPDFAPAVELMRRDLEALPAEGGSVSAPQAHAAGS